MRGPRPAPCIFPEEFLQDALATVGRRTASVQEVQRFRLVLLLHQRPSLSHEDVAEAVGLSARARQCSGGDGGGLLASLPSKISLDAAESRIFPPLDRALVQAMACETVAETELPLSRQSVADLTSRAQKALTELLETAVQLQPDVYLIYREDLSEGENVARDLADKFGAELNDQIIEVEPGKSPKQWVTRNWRMGDAA